MLRALPPSRRPAALALPQELQHPHGVPLAHARACDPRIPPRASRLRRLSRLSCVKRCQPRHACRCPLSA
eukprot:1847731-Pleurochrysis_carterae.AAC.6